MPSVRATDPTDCALVGGGLKDSTLRVRRQPSRGKKRVVNENVTTRKCFAFNKQRRKEQGLQQSLAPIPENSVFMTEYDLKSRRVDKEHAKGLKKCRLRYLKDEIKCKRMEDRHMKYEQYREQLALSRSANNTHDDEWHTVRQKTLGLSAVSPKRVLTSADSRGKSTQVNGNRHFSEEFLNFGNREEALFSSVNEAMSVVAPVEYANIGEVIENHACGALNQGQENVQRNCVSFSSVVDKLVNDDSREDKLEVVNHEEVKGRIGGQPDNRSIRIELATGTNAVSIAMASVGMGCRTVGGHFRESASSVKELKRSRQVPVDFYEALKEHNAILMELKNNETFDLQPRTKVSERCMRVKKRTVVIPSEVGYQPENPPNFCQAFVGKAQDDSRMSKPCKARYEDRLSEWTPWQVHLQVRDQNQFVYRRRGEHTDGKHSDNGTCREEDTSLGSVEGESVLEAVDDELMKRKYARKSAYSTSVKDMSSTQLVELMMDTGANGHFVGTDLGKLLRGRKYSRFTVMGSAGAVNTNGTGQVVASLVDDSGEEFEMRFEASELPGMKMNLLSASKLLRKGAVMHLEEGNSFVMLPAGGIGSQRRRKISLIERNGLYFLPILVDVPQSTVKARASVACPAITRSQLRNNVTLPADSDDTMDNVDTTVAGDFTKEQTESRGESDSPIQPQMSVHRNLHGPGATLSLWHKRLGVSKLRIGLMGKRGSVLGLNIKGRSPGCDRTCTCENCRLARAARINPRKIRLYDDEADRPFASVSSDIKGPLIESHGGLRYTIAFVDQATRMSKTYYMKKKSEAPKRLKEYLTWVKSLGWYVNLIRTDRGSEYFGNDTKHVQKGDEKNFVEFEKVATAPEWGCRVEAGPRDGSKGNAIVERYHRTIFEIASSFLLNSHASPLFWVEAYRYAEYLHNRMVTGHTGEFTPHEMVFRKRPRFDRMRVFGSDMYEHIGGLPKVPGGTRARKGYFMGIPEDSPTGYLMYDIKAGIIRTVYAATFDESFVRRRFGLAVYDRARDIYSRQSRTSDAVHDELLFTHDDDPFLYDIVRAQLDVDAAIGEGEGIDANPPSLGTPDEVISGGDPNYVGESVCKMFKNPDTGVMQRYTGEVEEHKPGNTDDEVDLWEIKFSDGDVETWELSELKSGLQLYKEHEKTMTATMTHQENLSFISLQKFKKRDDGLYDILEVANDDLLERDYDELKLRSLAVALNRADERSGEEKVETMTAEQWKEKGPLGESRTGHEAKRAKWENRNPAIRPFRSFSNRVNVYQESTQADRVFRKFALDNDVPVRYVQQNPKQKLRKDKPCGSYKRYDVYKKAETLKEMITLSCVNRPKGVSFKLAKETAQRDIIWDYERGFCYFPGNESGRLGHWVDSRRMAQDYQLTPVSEAIFPPPVAAGSTIAEPSDKVEFARVLNDQFKIDEAIRFLEEHKSVAQFAENSLRKVMFRHPETGKLHLEPKNKWEALHASNPDKPIWEKAMDKEIRQFEEFKVWEELNDCDVPAGTKRLGTKWILKIKTGSDGQIEKFKARLCMLGNLQKEHVHYDPENVYSPVMSYDSFRTLLAIGAAADYELRSADISGAFLQGEIDKDIYIKHPGGKLDPTTGEPMTCKLVASAYGLKQSPKLFAKALQAEFKSGGLTSMIYDPCLYSATHTRQYLFEQLDESMKEKHREFVLEEPNKQEKLYVGVWVDDLSMCHSSSLIGDWFISHLRKRFVINEKATGELSYMLSARITRDRKNRILYMDQSAAITRVAEKCGLTDDKGRNFKSPMSTAPLTKHVEKSTDFDYLSIVGSLLHICGVSRPDCAFSVSCLARHSKTAGDEHVEALLRLVRYLYQTRYKAITYRGDVSKMHVPTVFESGVHPLDVNKENPTKLFVDSDFAGTGGRSTAGFVVFMNGGPVIWSSKLMKVAATSSSEAEIIAAVESVKTAVHFRALLEELGLCKVKHIDVYEDNLSCRMSAESLRCHKKARHYQAKLRYLQDVVQAGMIKFHQTKTTDMIADLFTKPLMSADHHRLANTMLSDLPDRIVQLSEEARVTPRQVTLVDDAISSNDCIIDLEGFEEEEDVSVTRSVGCQAIVRLQSKMSLGPRSKYKLDRWVALMRRRSKNLT